MILIYQKHSNRDKVIHINKDTKSIYYIHYNNNGKANP